jgi:CelD/BcsL family acetyltransferase involved in cellulose biosynthesis
MSLSVREHIGELRLVGPAWDAMLARQGLGITRLDITATLEWAETLSKALLNGKKQRTLLLESDGEIVGVFPLYESSVTRYRVKFAKLAPITELYSGRCGFILREYKVEYIEALIDYLFWQLDNWVLFQLTLVDDSESETLLLQACEAVGVCCEKLSAQTSPYIVLDNSWQDYLGTLPKKFRWNLRNGRKKLESTGSLQYFSCESELQINHFLTAVLEIERASWKETAGTSITVNDYQEVFYKEFCAPAIDKGWFSGHLLELNGEPLAYIYGTIYQGVFSDFKESYKAKYRDFSPGHVLKTFVFDELYRRNVRLYDFMGVCEDYKLRWTDNTYSRSTYLIYNTNLRGIAFRIGTKLSCYASRRKSNRPIAGNNG